MFYCLNVVALQINQGLMLRSTFNIDIQYYKSYIVIFR